MIGNLIVIGIPLLIFLNEFQGLLGVIGLLNLAFCAFIVLGFADGMTSNSRRFKNRRRV